MRIYIPHSIRRKLAGKVPSISENDIREAFANREATYLLDPREDHQTDPPTLWFIAENDYGLRIKICFVPLQEEELAVIKTAYQPNTEEERIYKKFSTGD